MNMLLRDRRSHLRTFELVETQALRRRMETLIETLIATLDALDGEAELEGDAVDDEDGHDVESDMAELGIGDRDALDDPTLSFGCLALAFDGSGKAIADALLPRGKVPR